VELARAAVSMLNEVGESFDLIRVRVSSRGERVGTVTLDSNGVAVGDTPYAQGLIAETGVLEPGTVTSLRPSDGERYMRAMPASFDNAYFWATFYDGDTVIKKPWLVANGGTVPDLEPTDRIKLVAVPAGGLA
jgi:hypothetical protein